MNLWIKGLKGSFASKKFIMSLIILIMSFILALLGKIDGTAFAAIVATVGTIYMYTHAKTDLAVIANQTMESVEHK